MLNACYLNRSFVASTVSEYPLTKKNGADLYGMLHFFNFCLVPSPNSFINSSKLSLETIGWGKLLGRTLRPLNIFYIGE